MKKYKSKTGVGIVLFIAVILGSAIAIMIINHIWVGFAINLAVAGFVGYVFISTCYIIDGNDLIIKYGFKINTTIKIDSIKKIVEKHSLLSSPANSTDRIAIYYNSGNPLLISPKNKLEFIDKLRAANPKIEVILKN